MGWLQARSRAPRIKDTAIKYRFPPFATRLGEMGLLLAWSRYMRNCQIKKHMKYKHSFVPSKHNERLGWIYTRCIFKDARTQWKHLLQLLERGSSITSKVLDTHAMKYDLQDISSIHTIPRPRSAFTVSGILKTHSIIHSGEKPYKCDVFSAAFSTKTFFLCLRCHVSKRHFVYQFCCLWLENDNVYEGKEGYKL